jgi:6-phosphofructokinase 2
VEQGVYLIKPNLRELRELAGESLDSDQQIAEAARALIDQGAVKIVLVSLGGAGAMLVTADAAERIATPTVTIRSKVGAGDSLTGALALSLGRGDDLRRAVRFGIAAGAAAVMTPGTELCRREDTERLFSEMTASNDVEQL